MIFINKSINPVTMKLFVYASYVNTCLHKKKFGTVLSYLTWLINLSVFNMPFIN